MDVIGGYVWSRTRGSPIAGRVSLDADPYPGTDNVLYVNDLDRNGTDRAVVLAAVAEGDELIIGVTRGLPAFQLLRGIVNDTPVNGAGFFGFPFTVSVLYDDNEPSDLANITVLHDVGIAWPDVDELNQVLNLGDDGGTDWADTLERVLAAAIQRVKSDVGGWDDTVDLPSANQSQAALRMAFLMWTSPDSPSLGLDPSYRGLLSGQRRRFAIA